MTEDTTAVPISTGWPHANTVGNCWCGHFADTHLDSNLNGNCRSCQCVEYVEDKFAQNQAS